MKSTTVKRLSFLGVVLVAASAVTAAVLPNKTAIKAELADDGTLVLSSDGNQTCVVNPGGIASCSLTVGQLTRTTGVGQEDSNTAGGGQTDGNSSVTNDGTTSNVI